MNSQIWIFWWLFVTEGRVEMRLIGRVWRLDRRWRVEETGLGGEMSWRRRMGPHTPDKSDAWGRFQPFGCTNDGEGGPIVTIDGLWSWWGNFFLVLATSGLVWISPKLFSRVLLLLSFDTILKAIKIRNTDLHENRVVREKSRYFCSYYFLMNTIGTRGGINKMVQTDKKGKHMYGKLGKNYQRAKPTNSNTLM